MSEGKRRPPPVRVSLVAALDQERTIGRDGWMPWRLPGDLRRFRACTMGKPIVMGRRTHEAIGRVLPGRRNIVLTRDRDFEAPGCDVAHSVDEALEMASAGIVDAPAGGSGERPAVEVMIIGGGQIYGLFLAMATRLYLTEVHAAVEGGDTSFPEFDRAAWRELSREPCRAEHPGEPDYSFVVLERDCSATP